MFQFVRRIEALLNMLRSFNPPEDPPEDPFAAVREPGPRRPTGRSSAVALVEPDPELNVRAVGTDPTRARHHGD
jgi:hypothetical protein